ncbi:unnamed protein product [Meloidogyne enterolobii]|uniref:Uncharacterized protein n=2 Tax=Meloidogyne enterolobii TaxID=390850 RepID=A0ACB0ZCX5_MELEN|nr:unnamed protein product [Meloidogyne enterolobii]
MVQDFIKFYSQGKKKSIYIYAVFLGLNGSKYFLYSLIIALFIFMSFYSYILIVHMYLKYKCVAF